MLVSCIMPTRARPAVAAKAVDYWQAQSYTPSELVVIDDMDAPSFPGGLSLPGVQYHMLRKRLTIGEKRNLACSRATGEIICHWDDDDYSAPGRIADQVQRLADTGKPITGYCPMRFTDGLHWWEYSGSPDYALGTSLMYRREWWTAHPFNAKSEGEDNDFIQPARNSSEIAVVNAGLMMYATCHPNNTSKRAINNVQWRQIA